MVEKDMIITKWDTVERFRFVERAYNKKEIRGSGFKDDDQNEINLCGVIFTGNYAYATNNHFIGKIFIPDGNPPEYARYWDFKEDNEMDALKNEVPEPAYGNQSKEQSSFYNYIKQDWEDDPTRQVKQVHGNMKYLKQAFFKWRENLLKIKKDIIVDELDNFFGRDDSERAKHVILIKSNPENKTVDCKIYRINKKTNKKDIEEDDGDEAMAAVHEFSIPMHLTSGRDAYQDYTSPGICSVNCYYLYHILKVFKEYDIVDLCYDNSYLSPVILKGVNPRVDWKPDIRFALCQAKPKYSYPEKNLY